jgi:molybdopterin-containing oxidoreductase family membrane subunit
VFAVSTYLTVSLIYWYTGLIPDLANMRDRARNRFVKIIYGIFALGWRGSAFHWARYEMIYLLLAGLATPLVLSVHSVVSLDFSVAIVPGWHSTIFPPYFVAGAIFSGFAMVLTLIIPVRAAYGLKNFITDKHLDNAAKVTLATGLLVSLGYLSEHFMSWYSDEGFEEFMTLNRALGPYWPVYWTVIACNVLIPQVLWFRAVRYSPLALWIVALFINIGMWAERYLIVVVSLHRDFMPSAWGTFHGTRWDWMTLLGSFGLFFTLLFLFIRVVPMIAMAETRKDLVKQGGEV